MKRINKCYIVLVPSSSSCKIDRENQFSNFWNIINDCIWMVMLKMVLVTLV